MRSFRRCAQVLLGIALSRQWVPCGLAQPQAQPELASPCGNIQILSSQPLSAFPQAVQAKLRHAVGPNLQAIINDPGMGMAETKLDSVPLNALEIAQPTKFSALYIVAWDDRSFGVNGFNWIVELTPHGANNLMDARTSRLSGGFAVGVLGPATSQYPEVMFASEGFKNDGGAEAEDSCFHKVGTFYESTPCPATCHHDLNAR